MVLFMITWLSRPTFYNLFLSFISDSFLTDTEISDTNRGVNGQVVERELEEWTVDAEDAKIDHSLEGGSDMVSATLPFWWKGVEREFVEGFAVWVG